MYQSIHVNKGQGGWGTGLDLTPSEPRTKVVSITGGGIHPVAKKIAELSGAEAVDGFKNSIPEEEMMCVVIDCGGTARIGVYPMKRIPTVDVLPSSPSGPLAKHITEDIFVSGVKPEDIEVTNDANPGKPFDREKFKEDYAKIKEDQQEASELKEGYLVKFSRGIGKAMGIFYQAGRDSVDMLIKNIIPFMAFISMLLVLLIIQESEN